MSHDPRRDRITKGMIMTGQPLAGVCRGITPPSLAQDRLDELDVLTERLKDVAERIERMKNGDFS